MVLCQIWKRQMDIQTSPRAKALFIVARSSDADLTIMPD
jgi:hypothetical protein